MSSFCRFDRTPMWRSAKCLAPCHLLRFNDKSIQETPGRIEDPKVQRFCGLKFIKKQLLEAGCSWPSNIFFGIRIPCRWMCSSTSHGNLQDHSLLWFLLKLLWLWSCNSAWSNQTFDVWPKTLSLADLQQKYSKLLRQVLGDEWFEVGKLGFLPL